MLRSTLSLVALLACLAAHPVAQDKPAAKPTPSPAKATARTTAIVNLNTATQTELEQLPGVGAKVAARIIDYRTKKGPFRKIEELMNVQGVGEKSFLKLRGQLTVSGTSAAVSQQ